jgi:alpha-tubulin suppressor-like RCC1 family protein
LRIARTGRIIEIPTENKVFPFGITGVHRQAVTVLTALRLRASRLATIVPAFALGALAIASAHAGIATTTSLSASANPAAAGNPVTLTAAVSLGATDPLPTGTVSFRDGGATIPGCGALPIIGSGLVRNATCVVSAFPAGTRSIVAQFSGDAGYDASASAPLSLAVVSITPTALAFTDRVNAPLGAFVTSNAVTVTGITVPVLVAVSGGQYSVGCTGTFTTIPCTISPGQTVCVRHLTPLAAGAATTTTLTVGMGSVSFNSTTRLDPPDTQPADIAAGAGHNLAITPEGQVWGWGDNTAGKLGNGNTVSSSIPVRAGSLAGVMSVAAGTGHSLALLRDGTVWAWGLNASRQLGIGTSSPTNCTVDNDSSGPGPGGTFGCSLVPVRVEGLEDVVQIAAGWRQSFAVTKDGSLWSWGDPGYGITGPSGGAEFPGKVTLPGPVRRIAAGYMHTVVLLEDGSVYVWGRGRQGERGPAAPDLDGSTPTLVSGLGTVTDLAAGSGFTVARRSDGSLVAWGNNVYGALGDAAVSTGANGVAGIRATPAPVTNMTNVAALSAGYGFVVARKNDGTYWSWGLNNAGQLGSTLAPDRCGRNNEPNRRPCVRTPTQVAFHDGVLRIAAGGGHTLTLRPLGAFLGFGDNAEGQLGDGSGNFGARFVQANYDPDLFQGFSGTFGSSMGVARPGTAVGLNLASLDYGLIVNSQGIGVPSMPVVVTLRNLTELDSISIAGIVATGSGTPNEFASTSNCPASLGFAESCDISIVFTPNASGERRGTITIATDAPDSPSAQFQIVGNGTDGRIPTALTVSSSAPTSMLGTNVTLTASIANGLSPSGTVAFRSGGTLIPACAAVTVAAAKGVCTLSSLPVGVFSITAEYSGDMGHQASNSPPFSQIVIATPAQIGVNPASLAFGGQSVNTTAPVAQTVTLTNMGASALTVTSLAASAGFGVTHNCTTLAAAASYLATVTFTPGSEGAIAGSVTVNTNAGILVVPLSGVGERSLVTHFYHSILRRTPDAAGKSFWESERVRMQWLGANVNETWYAMATFFFFSAEYQSFNRNNTEFVTDLYNTFFNRGPDASGLAFWTGQLSQGMPREVVLVSFLFSNEFQTFTQAIFGNTQVRKEIDTVMDFYRGLLSRLPDDSGFNFLVQQFRTAQCTGPAAVYSTVESISSSFAGSAEYLGRNRTNAQFVGDMYNTFLRRGGDLAGVQFWINELSSGRRSRTKVRQDFIASPEFASRVQSIIAAGCVR